MFLGFSVGLLLGAGVAWLVFRRENKQLRDTIEIKQQASLNLENALRSVISIKDERAIELQRAAEAFQATSQTMEQHLAAERGRADRLAKALRMSEDARCELKQQLEKMRKQVNTTGSTILDEMKRRGEKPVFTAVMQRDLANIMAYNGTAQSQEVLTDE